MANPSSAVESGTAAPPSAIRTVVGPLVVAIHPVHFDAFWRLDPKADPAVLNRQDADHRIIADMNSLTGLSFYNQHAILPSRKQRCPLRIGHLPEIPAKTEVFSRKVVHDPRVGKETEDIY